MTNPSAPLSRSLCSVCTEPHSLCICPTDPAKSLALQCVIDADGSGPEVTIRREDLVTLAERAYAWGQHQSRTALSEKRTSDEPTYILLATEKGLTPIGKLVDALQLAIRQNSHDMMLTGDELRKCEAALDGFTMHTDNIARSKPASTASSGWVSVAERRPEGDESVLTIDRDGWMHCKPSQAVRTDWGWGQKGAHHKPFYTHWQPLPASPSS